MLAIILIVFVAIEHIGIMLLEMVGTPKQQAQAFDLPVDYTKQKEARVSFANQGLYNGGLGVMLLVSFWLFKGQDFLLVARMLLIFIVVVAIYGGFTSTKKVWLFQLLPAALALLCTM